MLIVCVGLISFLLGKNTVKNSVVPSETSVPNTNNTSIVNNLKLEIDNPQLYIDKQKAISFAYPGGSYTVKIDSEQERDRTENSGIPGSFVEAKGFSPPKVIWALKVEEKKAFQGRYGLETPFSPFAVWVFDNKDNIQIEKWFDLYWYYPFTWGSATKSELDRKLPRPKIIIDGEQTLGYDLGPTPRGYLKLYYIKRDDKMYLFQLLGEETNSLDIAIASTFKFLLPNTNK